MAPDRISDLPDDLIRHILSFLPSTKEAIRTGILSKRWHKQWTHVPVLIFRSMGMGRADFLHKTLALHDCSKVNTVYFRYDRQRRCYRKVALCDEIIRFATTRQVENLTLKCDSIPGYSLPAFLFNTTSLVKLRTRDCWCYPTATVNWASLKALSLVRCKVSDQSMQCILSGSPLLESLEVKLCYPVFRGLYWFDKLVITSKSLEKLVLRSLGVKNLEISCPNLEELCVEDFSAGDPKLSDRAIEYVVSNSLLLESFELRRCRVLHHPVIASRSLKRLVMSDISCSNGFEISCQGLEKLELSGFMNTAYVDFRDVPSSLCASLSFRIQGTANSLSEDILKQLQHIKELRVENVIYNYRGNFKSETATILPSSSSLT